MNVDELTLRDIAYVLAAARNHNFRIAADVCNVSQPALSKQIARLEERLNIQLFERPRHGVRLTELGAQWVEQAQRVWDQASRLIEIAHTSHNIHAMTWRVGIIASACPYVLPIALPWLREHFPQLTVREGLTDGLIDALKRGDLDAVWAAETVTDASLNKTRFYFEPFYLATAPGYARKLRSPIQAELDIHAADLLVLDDGHCLTDQTMDLCRLSMQATPAIRAQSLDTLVQLAASNAGVAVLPALPAQHYSKEQTLNLYPFARPDDGRHMVLYTRKTSIQGQQLCDMLEQGLGNTLQLACNQPPHSKTAPAAAKVDKPKPEPALAGGKPKRKK